MVSSMSANQPSGVVVENHSMDDALAEVMKLVLDKAERLNR